MPSLVKDLPSEQSGSRSKESRSQSKERVLPSIDNGLPFKECVSRSEERVLQSKEKVSQFKESGFGFPGSKTQNASFGIYYFLYVFILDFFSNIICKTWNKSIIISDLRSFMAAISQCHSEYDKILNN